MRQICANQVPPHISDLMVAHCWQLLAFCCGAQRACSDVYALRYSTASAQTKYMLRFNYLCAEVSPTSCHTLQLQSALPIPAVTQLAPAERYEKTCSSWQPVQRQYIAMPLLCELRCDFRSRGLPEDNGEADDEGKRLKRIRMTPVRVDFRSLGSIQCRCYSCARTRKYESPRKCGPRPPQQQMQAPSCLTVCDHVWCTVPSQLQADGLSSTLCLL